MVWELLLLSRKSIAISHKSRKCAVDNEVKEIIEQRLHSLGHQIANLEAMLHKSGLPMPVSHPVDGEKIIFIGDASILLEFLQQIRKRLTALGYVIRSVLTSSPLRLVAAQFMKAEMAELSKICDVIKHDTFIGGKHGSDR